MGEQPSQHLRRRVAQRQDPDVRSGEAETTPVAVGDLDRLASSSDLDVRVVGRKKSPVIEPVTQRFDQRLERDEVDDDVPVDDVT